MYTFPMRSPARQFPLDRWPGATLLLLLLLRAVPASAFPPAPHHLLYGMVRDEYGTPIDSAAAQVILMSASGQQLKTLINPGVQPGVNYKLEVPMDAGLTSDLYKPTAMEPTMPFRVMVVVGGRTNLPIELKGNFAQMGQPGKQSLMNLTLGEDTDGDGLPDARECQINPDISKVNPGDLHTNGLTTLQEYLAGIYPTSDTDGLKLTISGVQDGEPLMSFLAIQGRSYSVMGSTDFKTWTPVTFRIPAEDTATSADRAFYQATEVKAVELKAVTAGATPVPTFFKLMVQ